MKKKSLALVANNKAKPLEEYQQSRPVQLSLFELMDLPERKHSNTIELYDFMPKYVWGKVERVQDQFLPRLERQFECRGKQYKVKIDPAKIEDGDGKVRDYYPGRREELIEDALRKLACEGHGLFLDEQAGVTFTLYQLQQELNRAGHSYSYDQIKEALYVCAKTNVEVQSEDGSTVLLSSIFETLGLQSREDWQEHGQKTRCFVRFNSLVTASIKTRTFRQLNYETAMGYKSTIARQLHKRLSHHFTQAGLLTRYEIMLSTLIRDFGLTRYTELRNNLRDVVAALDELKTKETIWYYEVEKVLDISRRNRLVDAKISIGTSKRFCIEVTKANDRQKRIRSERIPEEQG